MFWCLALCINCGSLRLGRGCKGEQLIAGYSQGAAGGSFEVSLCSQSVEKAPCGFHTSTILWQKPQMQTEQEASQSNTCPRPVRAKPSYIIVSCPLVSIQVTHCFIPVLQTCSSETVLLITQEPEARSTFQGNRRNSLRLVHFTGQRTLQEPLLYFCNVVAGTNSGHQAWQAALPTEPLGQPHPGPDLLSLLLRLVPGAVGCLVLQACIF